MNEQQEDEKIKELSDKTWLRIKWVLYIGLAVVAIISFHEPGNIFLNAMWTIISRIGCGLLVAGASLAAGGFLGFIFGIPSLLQNQNLTASKPTTFKYNDNLVQISDWLTKIIVGVGLTQLNIIPGKVLRLGNLLSVNFGGGDWGRNAALALIFYFLLFGFLIIYFWTRTDFTNIMKKTDDDINMVKEENKKIKGENEAIKDLVASEKSKESIENNELASDISTISMLKEKSSDDLKQKLEVLKQKVKEVLPDKLIVVEDDRQKNRWGGKKENNGKQIRASVIQSRSSGFYDILITVFGKEAALDNPVAIFVHNSFEFPDDVIYVIPDSKGFAQVTLTAYEAFTVGALVADGTELELDLNEQPGYPEGFYWGKKTGSSQS
jgi:hypothetical protein